MGSKRNRAEMVGRIEEGSSDEREREIKDLLRKIRKASEERKGGGLSSAQEQRLRLARKSILSLHISYGLAATSAVLAAMAGGAFGSLALINMFAPGTQPLSLFLAMAAGAALGAATGEVSNIHAIKRELDERKG